MKVLYVVLFALFACASVFAQSNDETVDVVYLKDGSIVKGTVVEMVPDVALTIETTQGFSLYFRMDEVARVAKERLPQNRQDHVQPQATTEETYLPEQNRQNITQPRTVTQVVYVSSKEPALAWLFSFLLPGGGQYYNRDITKGIVMTTISVGTYIGMIASASAYVDGYGSSSYDKYSRVLWPLFGINMANWLWSMIDAPIRANAINRANGLASINVGKNSTLSLLPDVNVSAYGNSEPIPSFGAKMVLNFH